MVLDVPPLKKAYAVSLDRTLGAGRNSMFLILLKEGTPLTWVKRRQVPLVPGTRSLPIKLIITLGAPPHPLPKEIKFGMCLGTLANLAQNPFFL